MGIPQIQNDLFENLAVYGYVRLSRDEDKEKDSLENQKNILREYAKHNNFNIADIFEDDNVSGYTFERDGLNALKNEIENKNVDVLLVKDLSRIGRNNAKTLVFLDDMKDNNVTVISVTENIDSSDVDHDMMIGIKTWYNELYVKDISRKIKAALNQKQKEGLVVVPPFGYMEDPDKHKSYIVDPDAEYIINLIFKLYIDGYGDRKIAQYLNEHNHPTPAKLKRDKFGHQGKKANKNDHLWFETTIRRILTNDVYIGTLRCGKTKLSGIKGKKKLVDKEEHIIHKNFYPIIINEETFNLVQQIRNNRVNKNIRAKNEKIHRYAGILTCKECGKGFVARRLPHGGIVYRCATFHRYGSSECSSHTINEKDIDDSLWMNLKQFQIVAKENLEKVDKFIQEWNKKSKTYDNTLDKIKYQIAQTKEEIKGYAKQLARNLINEELFSELTEESQTNLKRLEEQLKGVSELKQINNDAKQGLVRSVEILNEIIEQGEINNKGIQLLVNEIVIEETDEIGKYNKPKLKLSIKLNTPFSYHFILAKNLQCDNNTIRWSLHSDTFNDIISIINQFNNTKLNVESLKRAGVLQLQSHSVNI